MRDAWNLFVRNRNYRLLLGANLISSTGTWVLNVGMMFYVYTVTGSILAAGTMLLAELLPPLLFGSIAGVFVDRWDRRRTMVLTNILLGLTLLPLTLVHSQKEVWIVYVVVFTQGALSQLFSPAQSAMVATIVPADDLIVANILNGQSRQIARLVGAAIGGLLAAAGGITAVALVDMASFLVAAGMVALIQAARPAAAPVRSGVWRELLDGFGICFRRRELSTLFVFMVMSGFGEGVFSVLLAPLIISVLGATNAEFGLVSSAQAVGGIVAALCLTALGKRVTPRILFGYGALAFGIIDLVIALYPVVLPLLWPVFVLMIVVGLPSAAIMAGLNTLLQQHAPDAYRGRVYGAIFNASAVAMMVGVVLASTLGQSLGIITVITLQGLIHVIAGPFVLARLPAATPLPPSVLAAGEGTR